MPSNWDGPCPRCDDTGVTGERSWSTVAELRKLLAHEDAEVCDCEEGTVIRRLLREEDRP